MQAYILFISPALFLMTAEFFFMLNDYKKKHKLKWFFNLILFLLIALPVRYMIERVKPFEQSERNPVWVTDLRKLNDRNISNGVLLNYDKPIEAMFYTNLTVYPNIPDRNKITDLLAKGYKVIINDDGKIPDDIKTIKGVTIERLNSR
jgi:urease gamma subunit